MILETAIDARSNNLDMKVTMKSKNSNKVLSKDECQEFYKNWDDENVKKEFFNHNIRLVYYIVKKYDGAAAEYDDLVQCASIGLWKAIKTFDPTKGFQFATYASRVMHNEILMLLRANKKGRIIDDKQIVSMDSALNIDADGNSLTFEDILQSSCCVEDHLMESELSKIIAEFVENYNTRNAEIASMYVKGMTQRMIADITGISQSYVSRIINKFKRDLKKHIKIHWNKDI